MECFFHKNPVLKNKVEYRFEAHEKDSVSSLSKDHGAEIYLEKDARKWAMRLAKHQQSIETCHKQIKGLRSVTSAYTKVSRKITCQFCKISTQQNYCGNTLLFSWNIKWQI